jgi:preprotein translocase subunit SecG
MIMLFIVLIVLIAIVLGFLVLIQAPKGGGLASNVGGVGNSLMGVKQTTDVLEKGTWVFVALLACMCLFSSVFVGKLNNGTSKPKVEQKAPAK